MPKPICVHIGVWTVIKEWKESRTGMGRPDKEGESPVSESLKFLTESGVLRDTRNLAGKSGDHPVRLNTPGDR